MTQKIKKKNAKPSSRAWIHRQLHDPYVLKAKQQGYRARSAFKLLDIDKKYHLLTSGMAVVDLGAAPGGWSQVLAKRLHHKNQSGKIIAIDILPIDALSGVEILQGDFTQPESQKKILQLLKGRALNGVLSDMAMNTTGHQSTDHLRSMFLAEQATEFAITHLAKGGFFITKVFQGGAQKELLQKIKKIFLSVKHIKPDSSRKESPEIYLLAQGKL
ncbi:MAG: RlmE family RNA methyltransferase [Alphaproteobacteria bacterium]